VWVKVSLKCWHGVNKFCSQAPLTVEKDEKIENQVLNDFGICHQGDKEKL
jgi:hypothetical protein